MTLAQIAKALGLPEGATLDDVIAALKLPEGATVGDVIAAIVAAGDAGAAAAPPPAPAASAAPPPAPAPEKVPAAAPAVDEEKIAASVHKRMVIDACKDLTPLERKAALSLSPSEAIEFVTQRVKANAASAPTKAHADEAAIAAVAKATGHSVDFVKGAK